MWCVAELNEEYVAKMEDVLATYEQPTILKNRWCAWMRSQSRCTPKSGLLLQPDRGGKRKRDSEYERCGTANVFLCGVMRPKTGQNTSHSPHPGSISRRGFAHVVFELALQYPQAKTIHLVMGA